MKSNDFLYIFHLNSFLVNSQEFFFFFQDVLHKITQDYGNVLRIVIFKKHGVQAMVEYPFQKKKKL